MRNTVGYSQSLPSVFFLVDKLKFRCRMLQRLSVGMMCIQAVWFSSVYAQPLNVTAPTPPSAPLLKAQPFTVYSDYGEGNAIANALRNSPPRLYTFDRASLRDVLRFLADDAGIPFISMQERVPASGGTGTPSGSLDDILVTFTMRASPFLVLESISKANDLALVYEHGVWFIRPYNEFELIGRIYHLKYTPQERVGFSGDLQSNQATTADNENLATPTIAVQQPVMIYTVEEPSIVREIKNMLRIPSSGVSGKLQAGEASVENFPPLPANSGLNPAGSRISGQLPPQIEDPSVTYNSDTNTIYIIATRQQHQWVEGFLAAADRPQDLIGIEVKFFETTRDPEKDVGINWAGTFTDGGWGVDLTQDVLATGNYGFQVDNARDYSSGAGGSDGRINGYNRDGSFSSTPSLDQNAGLPYSNDVITDTFQRTITDAYSSIRGYNAGMNAAYTAVLSPEAISFAIEAFMQDRETSVVQYPRVLTVNNREVAISNARNEPILLSNTSNSSGGTSTQTNAVQFLPIGTQLNILPKTMPDGSVFLNVAITVSNIITFRQLQLGVGQDNEYPVTGSRVYQAALQVNSGYTLAVGGLEEAFDDKRDNGIVLLKDIPGLGELFKSKGRQLNKKNLIVFITPTIIRDRARTTGITDAPRSVLPVRPGDPTPPAFGTDGRLVGGIQSLKNAIDWLNFQNRFFLQINTESRATPESIKQLEGVIRTAEMILAEIEVLGAKFPNRTADLALKEQETLEVLNKLRETLRVTRKNLF